MQALLPFFLSLQTIEPEFAAILGHNSAHSFATGPVTADPFISPLMLTITPALSNTKRYNEYCFKNNYALAYLQSKGSSPPFF